MDGTRYRMLALLPDTQQGGPRPAWPGRRKDGPGVRRSGRCIHHTLELPLASPVVAHTITVIGPGFGGQPVASSGGPENPPVTFETAALAAVALAPVAGPADVEASPAVAAV